MVRMLGFQRVPTQNDRFIYQISWDGEYSSGGCQIEGKAAAMAVYLRIEKGMNLREAIGALLMGEDTD